ncbi:MAG: FecR family protein [Steroidobacteraceae bacterium]
MSERPAIRRALSLRVRAEAAAWLAGLRDSTRTSELEGRFRRWLAASQTNRLAWERQNDAWELAGGLQGRLELQRSRRAGRPRARPSNGARMLFAVAAVLSAALVALLLSRLIALRAETVTTATGERRTAILHDGSRVTLNTDTRMVVRYERAVRRVRLIRGEALFQVRKAPDRPFIVMTGEWEIRALGTAFEVRRNGRNDISVTLIEGRIKVVPIGGARNARALLESESSGGARAASAQARTFEATLLDSPGERVTFAAHRTPYIDHPLLRQVIAWQSGDVVFDYTPLPEAAREMNRYSARQIRVEGPGMASLHVGGLFQAGESVAFARAIAETFGLDMRDEGEQIVLSRGR